MSHNITISWSSAIVDRAELPSDDPNYVAEWKKVGIWYNNGEEQGVVEIPCDDTQTPLRSESSMICLIECSLDG